jgi:hypothetical protein
VNPRRGEPAPRFTAADSRRRLIRGTR